jgi:hypothetical protein
LRRFLFVVLIVVLAACIALGGEVSSTSAQSPPPRYHALSSKTAQSQLKNSIASMTGLDPKSIEIQAANTVVSVRLLNTLYNNGPASGREYLASTIAALIEKDGRDNPSLANVVALHVQFLKRYTWHMKVIATVEFRRNQAGALKRHRT